MPPSPTPRRLRPFPSPSPISFIVPSTALPRSRQNPTLSPLSSHRYVPYHQNLHPIACLPAPVLSTVPSPQTTPYLPSRLVTPSPKENIHVESLNLLEWPQLSARVVRHASTSAARALLSSASTGLPIPSTRAESEYLLSQTREVFYLENQLQKPLSFTGVHDVAPFVNFAAKGKLLSGKELISIADTLAAARSIRRHIEAAAVTEPVDEEEKHPAELMVLRQMVASFRTWPDKEKEICRCLDEFGEVTEAADPQLGQVRQQMRSVLADVRAKMNDIMSRHSDAIQERVIMQRYDRFVLAVKTSRKAEFRRGIVHDVSSTGSTAYIEPNTVRPMNDRLRELVAKEKARVNAVLRKLCEEIVAPIAKDVGRIGSVLAELDVATARARCSYELGAVDVMFDDEKPLKLLGARHPLLMWQAMDEEMYSEKNDEKGEGMRGTVTDNGRGAGSRGGKPREPCWKKSVVPSSYELNEDVRCVCVTGPNTGGKTLCLKTLGVCVLMAKAGLFVPAKSQGAFARMSRAQGFVDGESANEELEDNVHIPYFDAVLADIGDDQSLVQSLSTFSGHVQRIKRILAGSTSRTLVLLDEIGSGTDPAEGAALGMAVLRHLTIERRAALTFATTHHGELKTLKYSEEESARYFENASVEFDDVRMVPTYKLIWGIPGRSNALAIAHRLGLSSAVVEEARQVLTGGSGDGKENSLAPRVNIERMISSLEKEKMAAEIAREKAEQRLGEVEDLRHELNSRLERLRESERKLRQDQKAAMEEEIKAAKKQIARVIREMQKGGGSAQAAGLASEKLGRIQMPGRVGKGAEYNGGFEGVVVEELRVGDRIRVPKFGDGDVEVVEVGRKNEVMVSMGGMKAKVKAKEIAGVVKRKRVEVFVSKDKKTVHGPKQKGGSKGIFVRTAANTVDIRGERVEGAYSRVEVAMDRALAMGALWVIHGHGTGRLRQGIREFLRNHELVERIEDGEESDGGTGVTVVYF